MTPVELMDAADMVTPGVVDVEIITQTRAVAIERSFSSGGGRRYAKERSSRSAGAAMPAGRLNFSCHV